MAIFSTYNWRLIVPDTIEEMLQFRDIHLVTVDGLGRVQIYP
jgi:hypothetical protein